MCVFDSERKGGIGNELAWWMLVENNLVTKSVAYTTGGVYRIKTRPSSLRSFTFVAFVA